MRSVSVVLLLAVIVMASATPNSESKQHYDVSNAKALFETFINDYNKNYKDEADKDVHFHAFVANLEKINKLNEDGGATFGINQFSDYTDEERKKMFGLRNPQN